MSKESFCDYVFRLGLFMSQAVFFASKRLFFSYVGNYAIDAFNALKSNVNGLKLNFACSYPCV